MKTWVIKIMGKEYQVKALKGEAKALQRSLEDVIRITQFQKTITGVIGGESHESISMSLFLPCSTPADPEGYAQDRDALIASLPDLITSAQIPDIRKRAREVFLKHLPVVDERETMEEVAKRQAERDAYAAKRDAEDKAWREKWCLPEMVQIPQGSMAVYASVTFDNSDIQTDYFDRHRTIGTDLLLAIVPKQAETQALARSVLARYPSLSKYEYEWHTEKWSMGHGNYLESKYTEHTEQFGEDEVSVKFEIKFDAYSKAKYAYKDYPGQGASISAAVPSNGNGKATVTLNAEHNGVEVRFPGKPEEAVISSLKANGFRWSFRQRVWYAKQSDATISFANSLTA